MKQIYKKPGLETVLCKQGNLFTLKFLRPRAHLLNTCGSHWELTLFSLKS